MAAADLPGPGDDPTHLDPGNQWTASIYDQAIAYAALGGLASLDDAAGRGQDADKEEATYRKLHQKQLTTMDAIAGGITGRVSAAQTAEPPQ